MVNYFLHLELMIYVSICGKLISQFLLRVFTNNLKATHFLIFWKEDLMAKLWVIWKTSFTTVKSDQKMNIQLKLGSWMVRFLWVLLLIWWEVWAFILHRNKYRICRIKSGIVNMSIIIKKRLVSWNCKLFWSCLSTIDPSTESLKTISLLLFLS